MTVALSRNVLFGGFQIFIAPFTNLHCLPESLIARQESGQPFRLVGFLILLVTSKGR